MVDCVIGEFQENNLTSANKSISVGNDNYACADESIIIGNDCITKPSAFRSLVIGNNIVATKPNTIYFGFIDSPTITQLQDEIKILKEEINLLREMITWHPDNSFQMSDTKEHFESLCEFSSGNP